MAFGTLHCTALSLWLAALSLSCVCCVGNKILLLFPHSTFLLISSSSPPSNPQTHLFQAPVPLNFQFNHSYSYCLRLSPQCLVINLHTSALNRTSYISATYCVLLFYGTLTLNSQACRLQGLILAQPPLLFRCPTDKCVEPAFSGPGRLPIKFSHREAKRWK